jgi:monothiol glutaredoxin
MTPVTPPERVRGRGLCETTQSIDQHSTWRCAVTLTEPVRERLQSLVDDNKVVVFMKGDRSFPQCGFSAQVVQILDDYLPKYETVNVLAEPEVRQGVKEFSDWPTIPQLYVDGEFVGGCDIVRDMHQSGELSNVLGTKPIEIEPPEVTITDSAKAAFEGAAGEQEYEFLRFEIGPAFSYGLSFGPALDGDVVVESNGFSLRMDRGTARKAGGTLIDFADGPQGSGFKIENPNEPTKVKNFSVQELKAKLDAGDEVHLFDVRPAPELAIASLDAATPFDAAAEKKLEALDKDAFIVFMCRSGRRSMMTAQHWLAQGYTNLHNLDGGILAWSDAIDSSIPKY